MRSEKIAAASAQDGQGAGGAGEHEGIERSGEGMEEWVELFAVDVNQVNTAGLQIRDSRDAIAGPYV